MTSLIVLCLASYFKGNDFIRECKRLGAQVILITREKVLGEDWAVESLDGLVTVSDSAETEEYIHAASAAARQAKPDLIVALEEADVVTAARIREHLCIRGITSMTARLFRDKLAMRVKAVETGIRQPEFVHLLNYQEIGEFMERVPPPWVVKPRADASSIGIHKLLEQEEVWRTVALLDAHESSRDRAPSYLLERFVPGDVYHVNSLIDGGQIVFADASLYARPPLDVSQHGGVSISHSVARGSDEEHALFQANCELIAGLQISYGTSHAEFIMGDGGLFFLEVGARVGGAYTAETLDAARGINIWREWARIEIAQVKHDYEVPQPRQAYSGSVVSLARQEHPDTSHYNDPEIVYRIRKPHHVGLIVCSTELERVRFLLHQYASRFREDFTAVAPQQEHPE